MTDHIVVFEGNERLIGQNVSVMIDDASAFTLFGTVATQEQIGVENECRDGHVQPAWAHLSPGSRRIGLPLA
jgi:tRNA-2-methylthio-N6-dimethylallyladenosine synthase